MALTKAELRDRTLQHIEVLPAGQAASGEDSVLMSKIIDETFSTYADLLPFLSSSTPDWAAESIVALLGARASPYFGQAPVAMTERDALAMYTEARNLAIRPSQTRASVEYY